MISSTLSHGGSGAWTCTLNIQCHSMASWKFSRGWVEGLDMYTKLDEWNGRWADRQSLGWPSESAAATIDAGGRLATIMGCVPDSTDMPLG
jgi:hypothetical protein